MVYILPTEDDIQLTLPVTFTELEIRLTVVLPSLSVLLLDITFCTVSGAGAWFTGNNDAMVVITLPCFKYRTFTDMTCAVAGLSFSFFVT